METIISIVTVVCTATTFITCVIGAIWLSNKREERDAERLYFKETGKLSARYLKGD